MIRGATVGPSPDWLRRRLEAVGVRSINNVVDATNYVMLELNQPMHAYDLAKLRGATLVVRRARAGERLVTLDDVERHARRSEMIADRRRRAASSASPASWAAPTPRWAPRAADILLEAAWWDPAASGGRGAPSA